MKTLVLLLLILTSPAQAGWVWIDGKNVWVPEPGELNHPPIPRQDPPRPLQPPTEIPQRGLTAHAPGWQYDQHHVTTSAPVKSSITGFLDGVSGGMAPGQAEAIASGASFTASFIGLEVPVAQHTELHQAQRESESKAEEYKRQAQNLEDYLKRLDAIPPIAPTSFCSLNSEEKVSTSLNKWINNKVEEATTSIKTHLDPHYDTTVLSNEISNWNSFSVAKKQVLLLVGEYSALSERRLSANLNADFQNLTDIAIQSGLNSLTNAAAIAGVGLGDFCGAFEVSKSTLEIAKGLLDVGLSFTPGISVGKDSYEAITGKSLIDGTELDWTSRSFAVLGVATVGGSNIVKSSLKGLVKIGELAHVRGILGHGFYSAIHLAESGVINITRHTPLNGGGPLALERIELKGWEGLPVPREYQQMQRVSETFRSSTYISYETTQTKTLWRTFSAEKESMKAALDKTTTWGNKGKFYTSVEPTGSTQVMIDAALERSWKSKANVVMRIEVPVGQTLHEGATASIQRIGHNISEFVSGGNQVYINVEGEIPREWIKEIRRITD